MSFSFAPDQASSLARESLVSLTSQRPGEWFKEEIRILGGLDHVINAGMYIVVPPTHN